MTFCGENQNKSEIITKVEKRNNYYTLQYLDGSEVSFYNNDKNYYKKLETQLIEQAEERNYCNVVKTDKWCNFFVAISSLCLTNIAIRENILSLACVSFIASLYYVSQWRKNSKRLKELKKYKILLENYEEFKNDPNIAKVIEFEPLYREPVNIFTIDNFSLYDMKLMQKSLKK